MANLIRIPLLMLLVTATVALAQTQESLPDRTGPETEAAQTGRIVDHRPFLYSLKRDAHPLTWLEAGLEPVFRSAENGWIHKFVVRQHDTDKTSGVAVDIGGAGYGSGLGPRVTLFDKNVLGRGIAIEIPLLYTYSQYQSYQFKASLPLASSSYGDRLSLNAGMGYASRARDDFFGIGNESQVDDERQYRLVTREVSAGLSAKLNDDWTSEVRAGYRRVGVTKPTAGVSAQDHFDSSVTPALYGAELGSTAISVTRNTQLRENYAFQGGLDRFEVSFNRSVGGGEFAYWRYRIETQHFFWLTSDGRKVIAARGLVETDQTTAGHLVPFFDMPTLGLDQPLRGFENSRFRDKSALGLTLEYRYRIWPAIDWGFFLDQGQVAPQLGDMSLSRFHTGYGVRLFVWPKPNLPISIDYGRSGETWRLYATWNATF